MQCSVCNKLDTPFCTLHYYSKCLLVLNFGLHLHKTGVMPCRTRVPQNTYPVHAEHCQWTVFYREFSSVLPCPCSAIMLGLVFPVFLSCQGVSMTVSQLGEVFFHHNVLEEPRERVCVVVCVCVFTSVFFHTHTQEQYEVVTPPILHLKYSMFVLGLGDSFPTSSNQSGQQGC